MFRSIIRATLFAAAFAALTSVSVFAQCRDAWVSQAVKEVRGNVNGSGDNGDCNYRNYGGGQWSSYPDLKTKVQMYFHVCNDPWVTQAVTEAKGVVNGYAATGDCNTANYGGGHWSDLNDLRVKVKQHFGIPTGTPQPQQQQPQILPPPPQAVTPLQLSQRPSANIRARLTLPDGKCLGVEGGSGAAGARLIRWDCITVNDQFFTFYPDGTVHTANGMCIDDKGGMGHQMDQIVQWPCNGGKGQHWTLQNSAMRSAFSGFCLDIRGGVYVGNADAILYQCNGGSNQSFHLGFDQPANVAHPGPAFKLIPGTATGNGLITPNGSNIVAAGGGNIVASGGGNIVAAGGGNIVAAGGGNIVASGGGN